MYYTVSQWYLTNFLIIAIVFFIGGDLVGIEHDNTFQISIRLPVWLHTEIKNQALDSDRTLSDQIRYMLKKYIEFQKIT